MEGRRERRKEGEAWQEGRVVERSRKRGGKKTERWQKGMKKEG